MRIISGSLKGKSINFLKNSTTRPLKDAVRENIFNVLKHSNLINGIVENANILDLYSGIGSFGLECIFFLHHSSHSLLFLSFKDLENSRAFLKSLNFKSKTCFIYLL